MTDAITKPQHWDHWIHTEASALVAALPVTIPDEDLKRARARLKLAFQALPADSEIYACRADSVVTCLAMSAMTGLFPGGHNPDVYLIPRKRKRGLGRPELNWQISYRGYVRLARRTAGWDVQPIAVFESDHFEFGRDSTRGMYYDFRASGAIVGRPDEDWKNLRGVFLVVTSPTGEKCDFLTKGQIQQRRNKAETDRIWAEWPIEKSMATACRWGGQREMWPTDDPSRYAMEWEAAQAAVADPKPRVSLLPELPSGRKLHCHSDLESEDDAAISSEEEDALRQSVIEARRAQEVEDAERAKETLSPEQMEMEA